MLRLNAHARLFARFGAPQRRATWVRRVDDFRPRVIALVFKIVAPLVGDEVERQPDATRLLPFEDDLTHSLGEDRARPSL
jgi:hypothetical protein